MGSDRIRQKPILGFREWANDKTFIKKNKKDKKNEQSASQGRAEVGNVHQQGQAAGGNSEISQQTIHVFAVPEL